jgi:hypothetical protein
MNDPAVSVLVALRLKSPSRSGIVIPSSFGTFAPAWQKEEQQEMEEQEEEEMEEMEEMEDEEEQRWRCRRGKEEEVVKRGLWYDMSVSLWVGAYEQELVHKVLSMWVGAYEQELVHKVLPTSASHSHHLLQHAKRSNQQSIWLETKIKLPQPFFIRLEDTRGRYNHLECEVWECGRRYRQRGTVSCNMMSLEMGKDLCVEDSADGIVLTLLPAALTNSTASRRPWTSRKSTMTSRSHGTCRWIISSSRPEQCAEYNRNTGSFPLASCAFTYLTGSFYLASGPA